jgi:sulfocyanin
MVGVSACSRGRITLGVALTAAALGLVACGSSSSSSVPGGYYTATPAAPGAGPSAAASPGSSGTSQYLSVDAAAKSVTVDLIAAKSGAGNTFNFNGYSDGKMTVSVPVGWKVTVNCRNQGSIPHSCSIVSGASSTTPAFPGATSPNPTTGVPPGGTQTFSFTPDRTGSFRIACLVPGHEDAGMWDTFQVTASGSPSISTS